MNDENIDVYEVIRVANRMRDEAIANAFRSLFRKIANAVRGVVGGLRQQPA